jgi:Ni/Co efflux regulator RcnB
MKIASVALIALSLTIPSMALADPGKGKQAAHGKGHAQAAVARGDNGKSRARIAVANDMRTPPGLAKKPYGMPPGQAKKVWGQGDRLPNQYYTQSQYYVANPSAVNLAPAPYGSRWVRVGDNYYQAQTQTGVVSQIVSALLR